jgi:predicted nucleic acid-binding protein
VDHSILRAVALDRAERSTYRRLVAHLGAGEAGTIAAARHRGGVVVSDDLAARRTCADLDVPVTGTIGILKAAVRDRELTLSGANALLAVMIQAGFYAPVDRIT